MRSELEFTKREIEHFHRYRKYFPDTLGVWAEDNQTFFYQHCHAKLINSSRVSYPDIVSSGMYGNRNPTHVNYLNWVVSDKSPWFKSHGGELNLLRDENDGGVIAVKTFFPKEKRSFLYNFYLAGRIVRDRPQYLDSYGKFKSLGIPDLESLLLSPYLSYRSGQWIKTNDSWNASHTGLHAWYLNFKKIQNGDYDCTSPMNVTSRGWGSPGYNPEDLILRKISSIGRVRSKFSSLESITDEQVLKIGMELLK